MLSTNTLQARCRQAKAVVLEKQSSKEETLIEAHKGTVWKSKAASGEFRSERSRRDS
jgi:hypothetical protein